MKQQNSAMLKDGFAPAAEVARCLGAAITTVHRWVEKNEVSGKRLGRYWYVLLSSLAAKYPAGGEIQKQIAAHFSVSMETWQPGVAPAAKPARSAAKAATAAK